MPSFFKAGKQAFTSGANTYTGTKKPNNKKNYQKAAEGFATAMAESMTNNTDSEKKTVSKNELLTRLPFFESKYPALTRSRFDNGKTLSIREAAGLILQLDLDNSNQTLDGNFIPSNNPPTDPAATAPPEPTDPSENPPTNNKLFGNKHGLLKLLGLGLGIGLLVKFIKNKKAQHQCQHQHQPWGYAQILSFGGRHSTDGLGHKAANVIQL